MNTISNMQLTQNNYQRNKIDCNIAPQYKSNVQFKGLIRINPKEIDKQISEGLQYVSNVLCLPNSEITNLAKNKSGKRINFLVALAEKYNKQSDYMLPEKLEDPRIVTRIFESVEQPTRSHIEILDNTTLSIKELENVFKLIGTSASKGKLAEKVSIGVNKEGLSLSRDFLVSLLSSEYSDEYSKNFAKYKSFFKLHKRDDKAVDKLDNLIKTGNFNQKKYDNELELKKVFAYIKHSPEFNAKELAPFYSEEGNELIRFFSEFDVHNFLQDEKNSKLMADIYKTTNKNNIDARKQVLSQMRSIIFTDYNKIQRKEDYLKDVSKLFNLMDNDKHAMKFVSRHIVTRQGLYPVEYNELFENIEPKKLDIFYDNVVNVIKNTNKKERIDTLRNEIENPFFKNPHNSIESEEAEYYGFKEKESIFSKGMKSIKNGLNKLRYRLSKSSSNQTRTITETTQHTPEIQNVSDVNSKIAQILQPQSTKTVVDQIIDGAQKAKINNTVQNVLNSQPSASAAEQIIDGAQKAHINSTVQKILNPKSSQTTSEEIIKGIKPQNKLPIAKQLTKREIARLKVVDDVNDIIKKKLGSKTLDDQQKAYANKATKIRLSILPEAFESVKETRKADRLAGKRKSNSSNADVYDLYKLANGKNKKLINYMLKKRNADGTRMFEVKDIIKTLEDATIKAKQNKLSAKDEKAMFDNILEAQISEHGKLQKTTARKK